MQLKLNCLGNQLGCLAHQLPSISCCHCGIMILLGWHLRCWVLQTTFLNVMIYCGHHMRLILYHLWMSTLLRLLCGHISLKCTGFFGNVVSLLSLLVTPLVLVLIDVVSVAFRGLLFILFSRRHSLRAWWLKFNYYYYYYYYYNTVWPPCVACWISVAKTTIWNTSLSLLVYRLLKPWLN